MKFPLSAGVQHWTSQPVIVHGHGLLRVCVIMVRFLECAHFRVAQPHPSYASH